MSSQMGRGGLVYPIKRAVVLAVCALFLNMQQAWGSPSAVDGAIVTHSLENGLKLVMRPDHKAPLVAFEVWYDVGSRDERFGATGVSHFLEHLLFQGAKRYGTGEFDRRLVRVGASNNAFTTKDFTAYYEVLPREQLELAFDLESDRMTGALIPPEKFVSEKQVVKEELRWRSDNNPVGACWELLTGISYLSHPYHWPVGGYPPDLDAVSRDEVVTYYHSHYQPGNATVVITGDFEPSQAVALANRYFGSLQGSPVTRRRTQGTEEAPGERRAVLRRPVDTPAILMGYRLPGAGHPDLVTAELTRAVLAEGESSRLYQSLVRRRRLAQSVEMGIDEGRDGTLLYIYAQPLPGVTIANLEQAIDAELALSHKQVASAAELKKAINGARARFVFAQESAEGMATLLGQAIHLGGLEALNDYLPRLAALGPSDVPRFATKYLNADTRTVIHLLPEANATGKAKP